MLLRCTALGVFFRGLSLVLCLCVHWLGAANSFADAESPTVAEEATSFLKPDDDAWRMRMVQAAVLLARKKFLEANGVFQYDPSRVRFFVPDLGWLEFQVWLDKEHSGHYGFVGASVRVTGKRLSWREVRVALRVGQVYEREFKEELITALTDLVDGHLQQAELRSRRMVVRTAVISGVLSLGIGLASACSSLLESVGLRDPNLESPVVLTGQDEQIWK